MAQRRIFIALAILVLHWAPARAQTEMRDVYTVASVPVDKTAANAAEARDEARRDGEERAYTLLLDRLTLDSDHARLPPPDDTLLDDLISGFEVANERSSGVRYLANYTYHFRAEAVRNLLRQANIPFCETPSKPLVVLPILQAGGSTVLWEDPNPWREAWTANPPPAGLVPLVLPYGDLEDVQAIGADAAMKGDTGSLQAISGRYGNADVLVTVAVLTSDVAPHAVAVTSTRYSPAGEAPPQSWSKTFTAAPDQSDGDLLAAAVAGTADAVEEAWKEANILDYSQTGTITVTVPAGDLDKFVDVENRLAGVPAVQHSALVALNRQQATLSIRYYGAPAQLKTALAQRDLALEGQAPNYTLERAEAPAAPAPPAQAVPAAAPPAQPSAAPTPDLQAPPPPPQSPPP
jgi:hypothetical protein